MWIILLCKLAIGGPSLDWDTEAGLTVGHSLFDDLWVGDLLLGDFSYQSSFHPMERMLFFPWATASLRVGMSHRFRLTWNMRGLSVAPSLKESGDIGHVWLSDGHPLSEAWKERLFVDELSWRFRPDGDPAFDVRIGILPFQAGAGRYLVESWPGARLGLDLAARGWVPLNLELKTAVVPNGGSVMAAFSARHEPSFLEHVGFELAYHYDPRNGLTSLVHQEVSMVTSVFGRAVQDVIRTDEQWARLLAFLKGLYLEDGDLRLAQADMVEFLDMGGRGHVFYPAFTLDMYWGRVRFSGLLAGALGFGTAEVNFLAPGADFSDADEDWAVTMPTTRIEKPYRMSGWAFDFLVEGGTSRWRSYAFFQGMTGDPDLVNRVRSDKVVRAFLAPDQAFLRTRLFPINQPSYASSWTGPPGVSLFGLFTPGAGVTGSMGPFMLNTQVAFPMTFSPAFDGTTNARRLGNLYGVEWNSILSGSSDMPVRPSMEGGLFFPGAFFKRSDVTAPVGWRIFGSVTVTIGDS